MSQSVRMYDSYHEYEAEGYQPNDRFRVRSSVFLPSSDVDLRTGMLREDQRRRGRTQALRMEANRLDEEYAKLDAALQTRQTERGFRMPLSRAALLVLLFLFIFGIVLLMQRGTLAQRQRGLKNQTQRIEQIRAENVQLQKQIDEASDAATICYAAARDLGMVPAASAQAIHLTAMDTRPAGPAAYVSASTDGQSSQTDPSEAADTAQTASAP
ncbi:MAG: hypothetical protein GX418_03590 [Clostridiales bacterium]|nr:hypothetical protein [Clostridiales bacterium]